MQQDVIMPIRDDVWNDLIDMEPTSARARSSPTSQSESGRFFTSSSKRTNCGSDKP